MQDKRWRPILVAGLCCLTLVMMMSTRSVTVDTVDTRQRREQPILPRRDVLDNGDTPLRYLREHGLIDIPDQSILKILDNATLFQIYHSYLDNTNVICRRKLRMGYIDDGGWEVCDDVEYRPTKPCLVYSFGINYDFSFDDDIARLYECEVFSFDPSMIIESYRRSPLVNFLKLGIAGGDYINSLGWDLRTLSTIKQTLHHSDRVIDVLKMDVEMFEWDSLVHMIESGAISKVRQLLVEFHGAFENKEESFPALAILREIQEAGFRKFYVHKNPSCKRNFTNYPVIRTKCYEVHYVNVNVYEY